MRLSQQAADAVLTSEKISLHFKYGSELRCPVILHLLARSLAVDLQVCLRRLVEQREEQRFTGDIVVHRHIVNLSHRTCVDFYRAAWNADVV